MTSPAAIWLAILSGNSVILSGTKSALAFKNTELLFKQLFTPPFHQMS